MTNLFENKATKYVLIACSLLIIAILACVVSFKIIEKRNVDDMYAIARKLGYTDTSQIAFYKTCWDTNSRCGMFLLFTTNKSFDEFKKEVDGQGFHTASLSYADGYSLFTQLNNHAKMNLTVDGNDTRGTGRLQIKSPSATRWTIRDQNGRTISVEFYEIAKEKAVYEIDGKRVRENIVTVILGTN